MLYISICPGCSYCVNCLLIVVHETYSCSLTRCHFFCSLASEGRFSLSVQHQWAPSNHWSGIRVIKTHINSFVNYPQIHHVLTAVPCSALLGRRKTINHQEIINQQLFDLLPVSDWFFPPAATCLSVYKVWATDFLLLSLGVCVCIFLACVYAQVEYVSLCVTPGW